MDLDCWNHIFYPRCTLTSKVKKIWNIITLQSEFLDLFLFYFVSPLAVGLSVIVSILFESLIDDDRCNTFLNSVTTFWLNYKESISFKLYHHSSVHHTSNEICIWIIPTCVPTLKWNPPNGIRFILTYLSSFQYP